MNLQRRIFMGSLATIAVMGVIALLSLVLLQKMRGSVFIVIEEYGELREIDRARGDFEDARIALTETTPRVRDATTALADARRVLLGFVKTQVAHGKVKASHDADEAETGQRLTDEIDSVCSALQALEPGSQHVPRDLLDRIDRLRLDVLTLGIVADRLVDKALQKTQHHAIVANTALVSLCILGAMMVWILATLQYRWVLQPLISLRDRVREAVASRGQEVLKLGTVDPVDDLGRGFDEMVCELNGLYNSLEARVQQKSQELVMSERLASVGYLAAGIAHEINNPLNTILGYTELTLRDVTRHGEDVGSAAESLVVVREETLRCKSIVEKLLSLVRNSDAPRETVRIDLLAREVVAMINSLKQFRGHDITVDLPEDADTFCVLAREAELKQVLLNLLINAVDAASSGGGQVRLSASRDEAENLIVIEVADCGQGMDKQTLERVFEPFFTRKRGSDQSGTGLGLSIVHAIVQDHGGKITAHSDGPGQGSRFVIHFAAVAPQKTTETAVNE